MQASLSRYHIPMIVDKSRSCHQAPEEHICSPWHTCDCSERRRFKVVFLRGFHRLCSELWFLVQYNHSFRPEANGEAECTTQMVKPPFEKAKDLNLGPLAYCVTPALQDRDQHDASWGAICAHGSRYIPGVMLGGCSPRPR